MGFYGKVTNSSKTQFSFDRIYPSRSAMEQAIGIDAYGHQLDDGVFVGRYVLVEYGEDRHDYSSVDRYPSSDDIYPSVYIKSVKTVDANHIYGELYLNRTINELTYEKIFDPNDFIVPTENKIYRVLASNSDNLTSPFTQTTYWVGRNGQWQLLTKEDNAYVGNYAIDQDYMLNVYGVSAGRGFDSTVWTKVYTTDNTGAKRFKYVMVAELNSVVPTFDVTSDAPSLAPTAPHFDGDSTNVYYKLHVQPSWGFRVKKASPESNYVFSSTTGMPGAKLEEEDTPYTESLSDEDTVWLRTEYNKTLGNLEHYYYSKNDEWVRYDSKKSPEDDPIAQVGAAIYYNKAGFDVNYVNEDATSETHISVTPTGKSGHSYEGHTKSQNIAEDIQELSISLPNIGNAVSAVWDIMYGNKEINQDNNNTYQEFEPIKLTKTEYTKLVNSLKEQYNQFIEDKNEGYYSTRTYYANNEDNKDNKPLDIDSSEKYKEYVKKYVNDKNLLYYKKYKDFYRLWTKNARGKYIALAWTEKYDITATYYIAKEKVARNLNIEWVNGDRTLESMKKPDNETDGLRLIHYANNTDGTEGTENDFTYTYEPEELQTVAGAINSVHDLMGMIIQDVNVQNEGDNKRLDDYINNSSDELIYYYNGAAQDIFKDRGDQFYQPYSDKFPYIAQTDVTEDNYVAGKYYVLEDGVYNRSYNAYNSSTTYYLPTTGDFIPKNERIGRGYYRKAVDYVYTEVPEAHSWTAEDADSKYVLAGNKDGQLVEYNKNDLFVRSWKAAAPENDYKGYYEYYHPIEDKPLRDGVYYTKELENDILAGKITTSDINAIYEQGKYWYKQTIDDITGDGNKDTQYILDGELGVDKNKHYYELNITEAKDLLYPGLYYAKIIERPIGGGTEKELWASTEEFLKSTNIEVGAEVKESFNRTRPGILTEEEVKKAFRYNSAYPKAGYEYEFIGYFAIDPNTKDKEEPDWVIGDSGAYEPVVTYAINKSEAFDLMRYDDPNIHEVQLEEYKFQDLSNYISGVSFGEFDIDDLYIKKDNLTYYPILTYYANKYENEYPALYEQIEKTLDKFNKFNDTKYEISYIETDPVDISSGYTVDTMKVFNGLVKPNPVNIQDIPYVALDADEFAKLTGLSSSSYMPIESSTVRAPEVREAILNAVGLYNILQSIYKGSFHCTYDPTLTYYVNRWDAYGKYTHPLLSDSGPIPEQQHIDFGNIIYSPFALSYYRHIGFTPSEAFYNFIDNEYVLATDFFVARDDTYDHYIYSSTSNNYYNLADQNVTPTDNDKIFDKDTYWAKDHYFTYRLKPILFTSAEDFAKMNVTNADGNINLYTVKTNLKDKELKQKEVKITDDNYRPNRYFYKVEIAPEEEEITKPTDPNEETKTIDKKVYYILDRRSNEERKKDTDNKVYYDFELIPVKADDEYDSSKNYYYYGYCAAVESVPYSECQYYRIASLVPVTASAIATKDNEGKYHIKDYNKIYCLASVGDSEKKLYIKNTYYYKDPATGIYTIDLSDGDINKINNLSYYKYDRTGNNDRQYRVTADDFYRPDEYFYWDGESWIKDLTNTGGHSPYYRAETYYVLRDDLGKYNTGAIWNTSVVPVPSSIHIATRKEVTTWKELPNFGRTLRTINGLILDIDKYLEKGNDLVRNDTTIQGCINQVKDIIAKFDSMKPNNIMVVDGYGRVRGADYITKQPDTVTNYGYASDGKVIGDWHTEEKIDKLNHIDDNGELHGRWIDLQVFTYTFLGKGYNTWDAAYKVAKQKFDDGDLKFGEMEIGKTDKKYYYFYNVAIDEAEYNRSFEKLYIVDNSEEKPLFKLISKEPNPIYDANTEYWYPLEREDNVAKNKIDWADENSHGWWELWHMVIVNESEIKLVHNFINNEVAKLNLDSHTESDKNRVLTGDDRLLEDTDNLGINNHIEDTIELYTPIVDEMGHVVGKNRETLTLPYEFKTINTANSDETGEWSQSGNNGVADDNITTLTKSNGENTKSIVADSINDELTIDAGNKWIRFTTNNADGESTDSKSPKNIENKIENKLTIAHETHSVDTTHKYTNLNTSTDVKLTESTISNIATDNITFQDLEFDKAGHVTKNQKHTYTLPFGYKTFYTTNNNSTSFISTTNDVKTSADNTKDELQLAAGNKWLEAKTENDKLIFAHETHWNDSKNGTTDHDNEFTGSDVHKFGDYDLNGKEEFKTESYNFDNAGHVVEHKTLTYELPHGYSFIETKGDSTNKGFEAGNTKTTSANKTKDSFELLSGNQWINIVGNNTDGNDTITFYHSAAKAPNKFKGDADLQTPDYGATFKVPYIGIDEAGHIHTLEEHTVTMPKQSIVGTGSVVTKVDHDINNTLTFTHEQLMNLKLSTSSTIETLAVTKSASPDQHTSHTAITSANTLRQAFEAIPHMIDERVEDILGTATTDTLDTLTEISAWINANGADLNKYVNLVTLEKDFYGLDSDGNVLSYNSTNSLMNRTATLETAKNNIYTMLGDVDHYALNGHYSLDHSVARDPNKVYYTFSNGQYVEILLTDVMYEPSKYYIKDVTVEERIKGLESQVDHYVTDDLKQKVDAAWNLLQTVQQTTGNIPADPNTLTPEASVDGYMKYHVGSSAPTDTNGNPITNAMWIDTGNEQNVLVKFPYYTYDSATGKNILKWIAINTWQ